MEEHAKNNNNDNDTREVVEEEEPLKHHRARKKSARQRRHEWLQKKKPSSSATIRDISTNNSSAASSMFLEESSAEYILGWQADPHLQQQLPPQLSSSSLGYQDARQNDEDDEQEVVQLFIAADQDESLLEHLQQQSPSSSSTHAEVVWDETTVVVQTSPGDTATIVTKPTKSTDAPLPTMPSLSSIHNRRRQPQTSRGGGGGGGGRNNNPPRTSNFPLEQGVICTLKESFGFIHCADRLEEIFFHYSSVVTPHPDELRIDDEVEFRVGSSARDPDKLAAYEVKRLSPDQKIEWEKEEGEPGQRYQGIVEKGVREDRRNPTPVPGNIRILVPKTEEKGAAGAETADGETEKVVMSATEGPVVRFSLNDYINEDSSSDPTWNRAASLRKGSSNGPRPLAKGDLIECRMFRDRRTKELWAREIRLLLSEKDRARAEAEKEMLSNATLEHGVITSLKGEYGFLKSNKRREEVFFHYSNIHLDEDGENDKEGKEDLVLKEGQDMQFLVVTEGAEGQKDKAGPLSTQKRVSARRVKMQPRGSVQFHETIAQGVVGRLVIPPQPVDSTHSLESHGRIHLLEPITTLDSDGNAKPVDEVFLSAKDSPGGSFSFHGGASVGMWVQEGDKILFDLVKDFVDGSCHAKPTRYLTPNETPLELLEGCMEYPDLTLSSEEDAAVRLIDLAMPMRADGVVNAVRETYGFLHYSERPVDVHFKLFQVLPENIQIDLRRNMGYPNPEKPLRLQVGAEASFDLSVHGTIHAGPPVSGGRSRKNTDRENLKAQRILFLPKGSVKMSVTLETNVEALVTKEDAKQAYSGTVELENPVHPMTLEQRHPFVAKAVESFLASNQTTPLVFHDVQTLKEDETYIEMIELKAKGKISWSYLPMPGETEHEGRLVLKKVDSDTPVENGADETYTSSNNGDEEDSSSPKKLKKKPKDRITKLIHFDKGCLSQELKKDAPPAVGDKVRFDVIQSRKTGVISVANMTMVTRHTPEIVESSDEALGFVTEIVPKRKFGFISVEDENASKRELLFFHLKSVESKEGGKDSSPIRKGDEVKFNIGKEKNGKRIALNVTVLPKGTVPTKADKNACEGFVLLEPSHTTIKNVPLRHASSNTSNASSASQNSRWENVVEKEVSTEPFAGQGCILLVSDPMGMFSYGPKENGDSSHGDKKASSGGGDNGKDDLLHLHYKNGALAFHGNGSSGVNDEKSQPKRGDLVSFVKGKSGKGAARDIRVVKRGAAALLRGILEDIQIADDSESESGKGGTAKFIAATPGKESFDVDLSRVVSCDISVLKDKESVEAVLHEGKLFGISRTADLYLDSKLGASHKQRPKLNLTVKKDRGGTIIAQSMMAKGPDGTKGFASGWTTRTSRFS
uniref:CSD domain-containing protein n=1 Tax=Amphora coffeiformis TaxID=265554 RepID=A0A7S3L0B6_9STRA